MDYYNPANKVVIAGDIVYASDLNSINTSTDVAFSLVETEIDAIKAGLEDSSIGAAGWATADQGTRPDFELDLYSSRAYAIEAKGWASGDGEVSAASTGSPIVGSKSAKTYATEAKAATVDMSSQVSAAASSATASEASSTKAQQWATLGVDTEVEGGKYSAYHWALIAANTGGPTVFFSGIV